MGGHSTKPELEAEKMFHRIRGYKALPAIVTAITKNVDNPKEVA